MTTDPLDLPMFNDHQEGRVRSTFRFTEPGNPRPAPATVTASVVPLHRPKPSPVSADDPVRLPDADWELVAQMQAETARRLDGMSSLSDR